MANQKPVDEIRIGRVKATIWKNGADEQPRHNVTFSRLYKDGDQWKSTQSFGRNDLLVLAKSGRPRAYAAVPASDRSRSPGGAGQRLLAVAPGRGGANRFAVLVLFFPRRLSPCLCYLPAHSFAVITLVSYSGLLVSPLSL